MLPQLIVSAIPFFFAAIAIEALVNRVRRGTSYRLGATVADLDTGITSQIGDAFLKGLGVALYAIAYDRFRWITLPASGPLPWILGILGIDFLYYWWHRASHVVNALWAVHAVHHQSEDYNLAVALRQPAFESLTIVPFHLPLALLGVPPAVYVSAYAIDLIAQFWIHTELIERIRPLEGWLNTPSAHRVHHGVDDEYLDKNFGGIFVVWDRLFGTYMAERRRPRYGVTYPLASYDPVWANFAEVRRILRLAHDAPRFRDKVHAWIAHPRWTPARGNAASPSLREARNEDHCGRAHDPQMAASTQRYVGAHFLIVLGAGGAFASTVGKVDLFSSAIGAAWLVLSMITLSAWTQGRAFAPWLDIARLVSAIVALVLALAPRWGALATAGAVALVVFFLVGLFVVLRPRVQLVERQEGEAARRAEVVA